jgi:hypothetical protein
MGHKAKIRYETLFAADKTIANLVEMYNAAIAGTKGVR